MTDSKQDSVDSHREDQEDAIEDRQPAPQSEDFAFSVFDTHSSAGEEPEAERLNSAAENPAALSITIQSWMTPIVGLVMLVAGLAGGYFARPLFNQEPAPAPQAGAPAQPGSSTSAQQPGQEAAAASPGDRDALMAALLPRVRHFRGNPSAPITLIEFSDFQ